MADPVKRICDEYGVRREEAISYLDGFNWELDAAMEACRIQTLQLPSLTVESPAKEKSSPEAPLKTSSRRSPNRPDERPFQSRDELIIEFYNVAVGADVEEAVSYLERNNWDLQRAILHFMEERRPTPSQMKSNRKLGRLDLQRYSHSQFDKWNSQRFRSMIGQSSSQPFSGDETSEAVTSQLMSEEQIPKARPLMASSQLKIQESSSSTQTREEILSPVKESAEAAPSSVSSSQLPDKLSQLNKESIESFRQVAIGASEKAAIACLNHCKWNEDDAISYFFGEYREETVDEDSSAESSLEEAGGGDILEATQLMASSQVKESSSPTQTREETLPPVKESAEMVIDSRTTSNQLQNSPEQPYQLNDEISLFVERAGGGVTRDAAIVYLTLGNWDVDQAICCLMEERSLLFSDKETSQVEASHGSRNQGYLADGETRSSSSSNNSDPAETGDVTVAIPGLASSQVDEILKDKAVDKDSSTEFSPVPCTTIDLEIMMADCGSWIEVWIPVRSDETVRDIRNRIEEFRPDNSRGYYFMSGTGVEYRDLNTTVRRITSGPCGSTTLYQLYST